MDPIYVTGHRNPDTDSIVAAMSYAALRNALGDREYEPACLGQVSDETQRVLDRFGFPAPRRITGLFTQIKDLDFDRPPILSGTVTVERAWELLQEDKMQAAIPVANDDGTLFGMLSREDVASYNMAQIDTGVLDRIISASEITKEDCVLEIGPGIGTMTQYLAESAREVIAVEIDKALIPILEDTLSSYDNVTVINDDILKVDINRIVEERNGGKPIKVVANLPYYITTPIIMGLFEKHVPLKSITIMVQKEVADRMQVGPGTKDYGALSLAVQYYAKPQIIANVPPNCFIPRPNVGSAVIRLTRYEQPPVIAQDESFLFALIRASFNQRRKTLANGLSNAGELRLTREQVVEALDEMGLSATIRGEALTLEQFAQLSNLLGSKRL